MCSQWGLPVQSSKICKIQFTWEDNFFPRRRGFGFQHPVFSSQWIFTNEPLGPSLHWDKWEEIHLLGRSSAPQTGECVQGDTGPAHSKEKSRVFYLPAGFVRSLARGGICVSVWPHSLLCTSPQWTPQTPPQDNKTPQKTLLAMPPQPWITQLQ